MNLSAIKALCAEDEAAEAEQEAEARFKADDPGGH